jgi:hypothetical protein
MADEFDVSDGMLPDDSPLEEVDVGFVPQSSPQSQDFEVGSVPIGESVPENVVEGDPRISSPDVVTEEETESPNQPSGSSVPSSYTKPAPYSSVSVEQLSLVESAFGAGCFSFQDLVTATKLPREIVSAAVAYLRSTGKLSYKNKIYCTYGNLAEMRKQLAACEKCV